MNAKRKMVATLSVMALALGLGGFIASTAGAAAVTPPQCLVEPGYTDHSGDIIHPAIEAQHYSLKGSSKNEKDGTPVTPAEDPSIWQATTKQEPHDNGNPDNPPVTWTDTVGVGLHYASADNQGHPGEGLRDWFYFQPFVAEWTEHHDVEVPAVYEDCPSFPVGTPFNAEPVGPDCFAPGFFDESALGGTLVGENEDGRTYTFDDGKVTLLTDISDPGLVHLYVFSTDDETVLTGLDATKWDINADQRSATRTITLGVQLASDDVACVTDNSPSPSPSPSVTPSDEPSPSPTPTVTPPPGDDTPTPTPTPTPGDDTPTPTPTPSDGGAPPATPVHHNPQFTG